jgi:transcriptional regulator with XRE-family HTH domain
MQVERRTLDELQLARTTANVSQEALAALLDWSQPRYSKFERGQQRPAVHEVCEVAAALGLEASVVLRRVEEGLRDSGQMRVMARFQRLLSPRWHASIEAPFPALGDLRSWDALLRLRDHRVGVEIETRLRDQQELIRRIRQREVHGRVDEILVVLSESRHNRLLVDGLRAGLGVRYGATPRELRAALRDGNPLPRSGVLLV